MSTLLGIGFPRVDRVGTLQIRIEIAPVEIEELISTISYEMVNRDKDLVEHIEVHQHMCFVNFMYLDARVKTGCHAH